MMKDLLVDSARRAFTAAEWAAVAAALFVGVVLLCYAYASWRLAVAIDEAAQAESAEADY